MEEIIKLLKNVYSTMETISVVGVENQDRFVGCAHAVRASANALRRNLDARASEKPDAEQPELLVDEIRG